MDAKIIDMEKRYNSWNKEPHFKPLGISVRSILRKTSKTKNNSGSGCKGACGGECEVQTCTSCKVEN